MAVPTTMADLSTTASSNSPAGSENPISTDDFHRAIQAILRHTQFKGADIASATTTNIGAATGEFVDITGTTTITGLGTIAAGIQRTVRFTGALTLTHNATSLILPTGASITTAANDRAIFRSLGSGNWICIAYQRASGEALVNTYLPLAGGTMTGDITMSASMQKWAKGADVASGTALPLITDGNYFDVTGTTTITSFNSVGVGTVIGLHFDGALTLTHNATDLILPSGANITTAAGDEALFVEYASGDYRCISYQKANGLPIANAGISAYFESSQQTITLGGSLTLAHGLGKKPILFQVIYVCTTTEGNYSVNDEVVWTTSDAGLAAGLSIVPDATNINVRYGSSAHNLINKTTGGNFLMTVANWKLVIRAWG